MPKVLSESDVSHLDLATFLSTVHRLQAERAVRNVVTRGGHRARGKVPSFKAIGRATFESLVEEDALRIAEISSLVVGYRTRPYVLRLGTGSETTHYTPDIELRLERSGVLIEVKGDHWLRTRKSRDALRTVVQRLRQAGLILAILPESEARRNGLQSELKALQRERPAVPGYATSIDPARWDPRGRNEPTSEQLRRWRAAQKACDDILDRVMRRDPDDVISAFEV